MKVVKANGELVAFDVDKIRRSLNRVNTKSQRKIGIGKRLNILLSMIE